MSHLSAQISTYMLQADASIREALERLQTTSKGALMLVDAENRLIRMVTDGDLRRLLLAGHGMHAQLDALPQQSPRTLPAVTTPDQALTYMNEQRIDHVPLVDEAGRPVQLLFRRDLDTTILLSVPHMGADEMAFVEEAFRTNWVAPLGPNVEAFEAEMADYVGVAAGAAVSSGTAAIHLGLRLLGAGPGDTVFCSSLTFIASANPILYQGATPVFIDSEPLTWNMSPVALERAFAEAERAGRRPKAVIVVNLYGQSADYDLILEICGRYGVPVLEDAAESLGATYAGRHSGTFGKFGVYSFNGNKIITTSGGGMLVSDDTEMISRARHLSTQAREPAAHYEHVEVGYNYRMSNVLAGIGRGQLRVLESRVESRRSIYKRYVEGLEGMSVFEWMPESNKGRSTHWLSACTLRGTNPMAFINGLKDQRIEARRLWKPMHLQPLFSQASYYPHGEGLDVSADLFARGVCLPSGSNMTTEQQERVVDALKKLMKH